MCWWQDALGPSTDPQAMLDAYNSLELQNLTRDTYFGKSWAFFLTKGSYLATSRAEFEAATKKPAGSVAWYMAVCRDGATTDDYSQFLGGWTEGIRYAAFATGRPPAPKVAPEDLAVYAQQLLDLPKPTMDYNPKLARIPGASVVGMATWFWVNDPDAAGGTTADTLSVKAEAGNVWAEVTATATGVTIGSDAGTTTCTPAQARTHYARGTPETSACTLTFTQASIHDVDGWPVSVTTSWDLAWTGSGGTGRGLGTQTPTWNTNIRVAEIQAVVTLG
jgi:enoyl reductase